MYCGGGTLHMRLYSHRDQGQSEVNQSWQNFRAGQAVKVEIGNSLETVKGSPGDQWVWLMLDNQGSWPDFQCGQGVKHENFNDGSRS